MDETLQEDVPGNVFVEDSEHGWHNKSNLDADWYERNGYIDQEHQPRYWKGELSAAGLPEGPGYFDFYDDTDAGFFEEGRKQGQWVNIDRGGYFTLYEYKDGVQVGQVRPRTALAVLERGKPAALGKRALSVGSIAPLPDAVA